MFLTSSREYSVEAPSYVLMALNPIDLARLLLLIRFDFAALLGYTGSLLQRMTGSAGGTAAMLSGLVIWSSLPVLAAASIFRRKDL
jgi:Cu-processing system permease protein